METQDEDIAETPGDENTEEEEQPIVVPIAENTDAIITRAKDLHTDYVTYKGLRYEVKYRRLPWKRLNQLTTKALLETAETPSIEDRHEQELILAEMIDSIGGRAFDEAFEIEMDGEFGEALRHMVFKSYGKNLIPEAMLGKLAERLKNWLVGYLKDEGKLPKGKGRKSKSTGRNIPQLSDH